MDKTRFDCILKELKGKIQSAPLQVEEQLNSLLNGNLILDQELELKIIKASLDARNGHHENAIESLEYIIDQTHSTNFNQLEVKAMAILSDIKQDLGFNEEALEIAETALSLIGNSPQNENYFELMNTKLIVTHIMGKIHSAIGIGLVILNELKEFPEKKMELARINNNLALNYEILGDLEKAENYYYKSYLISKEHGFLRSMSITLNNLGDIWYDFGFYEKAKKAYEEGIEIAQKVEDIRSIALLKKSYAKFLFERGNIQNAIVLFDEAIKIFKETEYIDQLIKSYILYSKLWIQKGDFNKAIDLLNDGLDLSNTFQIDNKKIDLLILNAEIWNILGNTQKAYHYLQEADSIAIERKSEVSFANILITKAKINFSQSQYEEVDFALQRALNYGKTHHLIDIQFNAKILLAQNYLIKYKIRKSKENFSRLIEIITDLSIFTRSLNIPSKYISVQIISGLLYIINNEKEKALAIFTESKEIAQNRDLHYLEDEIKTCLNITEGISIEPNMINNPMQQMLFTLLQDKIFSSSPFLSYSLYDKKDLQGISLVIYKIDEKEGPVIIDTLNINRDDPENHADLIFCGSLYATSIGQGDSYHLGLFGALPFGHKNLRAFIYTTIKQDLSQNTARSKNQSYFLITLIFPEKLSQAFNEREKLKNIFEHNLSRVESANDFSHTWLENLSLQLFDNYYPGY